MTNRTYRLDTIAALGIEPRKIRYRRGRGFSFALEGKTCAAPLCGWRHIPPCGSGDLVAARNGGLETAELGEMAELEDMK